MVAECRYALTGVGACIAFGSQKWKGNCADLVNAASRTSPTIGPYIAWPPMAVPFASNVDRLTLPPACQSITAAASSARPPAPVTSNA